MKIEILHRPLGAIADIQLDPNDVVKAEAGAMISMSANLHMETSMQGGALKGFARMMFSGESLFQNTFHANNGPAHMTLAHAVPGDMTVLEVPQGGLRVQSTSYVASHADVEIETKLGGFKTFFGGEGMFVIGVNSPGPGRQVILGAYGGITEMQVDSELVIDTGHLVAWDPSLQFNLVKASQSGWISSYLSGEGLACHFRGTGRVWIQSRNPVEFGRMIGPMLPPR